MFQLTVIELTPVIMAFFIAVFFTLISIPLIIKVDSVKHLTDSPGPRKVHHREIPTLGGVGIFFGFAISFLFTMNPSQNGSRFFFAALLMLFFTGVVDDLIDVRPRKKLMAEILAALIIISFTNIHFTNFHGFLGIHDIPLWLSFLTTIFIVIVIINSLNLIDGIDGLAASTGIIASIVLGLWFGLSGEYSYAAIAASLAGALAVFLVFNLSKGANKIFMGDSGSLIIGFILSALVIRFNEANAIPDHTYKLHSAPAVSIAVLIVPLYDTLRVFILRVINHQNPFKADKRHIHHLMLQAGFSHRKATLYISLSHIIIVATALLLDGIGILWLSLILLAICIVLTRIIKAKVRKNIEFLRVPDIKYNEAKDLEMKNARIRDINIDTRVKSI